MKKAESLRKGTEDMKKNQTGISELKQESSDRQNGRDRGGTGQ